MDGKTRWLSVFFRAHYLHVVLTVTLGFAEAYYLTGGFNVIYYVLTVIGVLLAFVGVDMLNDYVDFSRGVDVLYRKVVGMAHRPHPIIDDGVSAGEALIVTYVSFAAAVAIGMYFVLVRGPIVLIPTALGALIGAGYSVGPSFSYRGMGEVVAALGYAFVVWGAFIVQTGVLTNIAPIIVGLPGGIYGAINILGIGMRKYEASTRSGRVTLGTLIAGKPRLAKAVVYTMIVLIIVLMVVATLLKYQPPYSLMALAAVPWLAWAATPLTTADPAKLRNEWRRFRGGIFNSRAIFLAIQVVTLIIARLLY